MRMLQNVEARYSQALDLSRKHNVQPETLYEFHQQLTTEFSELVKDDSLLEELKEQLCELEQQYHQAANKLSLSRQKAAKSFAKQVEQHIQPNETWPMRCLKLMLTINPKAIPTKLA